MVKNSCLAFYVAVAAAGMVLATASCAKSDDKKSQPKADKPKAAIDAAAAAKASVDAAATPVAKADPAPAKTDPPVTASGTAPIAAATGDPDPKGKKPTNLEILPKNMSFEQVKTLMEKVMNRGLGVKCTFCHKKDDYADDSNKHKRLARKMMLMTNELNAKHFGGKQRITCYTCHMGKKEP